MRTNTSSYDFFLETCPPYSPGRILAYILNRSQALSNNSIKLVWELSAPSFPLINEDEFQKLSHFKNLIIGMQLADNFIREKAPEFNTEWVFDGVLFRQWVTCDGASPLRLIREGSRTVLGRDYREIGYREILDRALGDPMGG